MEVRYAREPMSLIMLVEDDLDILRLLDDTLSEEPNWSIRAYSSCEGALEALERGLRPDVIVFDVMMPGKDGNDLLRWRNANCPNTPAIAMSASLLSLTELGASYMLLKPFAMTTLIFAIHAAIGDRFSSSGNF